MPNKATITAPIGPGLSASAAVINNVATFNFKASAQVLEIVDTSGNVSNFDITGITTITFTVSNKVYTLTIT